MDVRTLGTILGVWAHPDDEAYLSAGVRVMATRAGSRVVCVTATRGELGSTDIDQWPLDTLADGADRAGQDALRRFKEAPITPLPILVSSIVVGLIHFIPVVFLVLAINRCT